LIDQFELFLPPVTHGHTEVVTRVNAGTTIECIIGEEETLDISPATQEDFVAVVDIWNEALTLVGGQCIDTVSSTLAEAHVIDCIWENFRKSFLVDHTWNGAVTITTLARVTDSEGDEVDAPTNWGYLYTLPDDYLRAWRINGDFCGATEGNLWDIKVMTVDGVKTRVLLSNKTAVDLEYIFDVGEQISLLSIQTQSALAHELAVLIAPKMGLSEGEIQGLRRRADRKVADAKGSDGQEGTPKVNPNTDLLDSRW